MRYAQEGHRGHGHGGGWFGEARRRGFGFPPGFPFGGPGGPGGPGFGPDFGHRGPRRGGRGARQNVRPAILALLVERPMHGYEMIQELDARTNGIWRPSPGSVYPTLQLLEDEGLIEATAEGGRKSYQLTADGRPEAETAAQNPPWAQIGDETMLAHGGLAAAVSASGRPSAVSW